MTSLDDKPTTERRPHDAEATRQALLEAGRAVFDEVGYERATTREIGERAGVDPALIARYFDGKEGLFLAAIAEVAGSERRARLRPAGAAGDPALRAGTSAATARSAAPSPARR